MGEQTLEPTPVVAPARGGRRRFTVALLVTVLAVLGAGLWWVSHPTWFADFAGEESSVTAPGRPLWVGITFPNVAKSPVTVHLGSVTAHTAFDSSSASVTSFVCTNRPQPGRGLTVLGTGGPVMVRRYCIHLVRADDADMTVGRGHPEYLVLRILPAHTGRLRVDRIDVNYRKGLQQGSQSIGFKLTVSARPGGA
jgi:hypothetical protein